MIRFLKAGGLVLAGILLWAALLNAWVYTAFYWPAAEPEPAACWAVKCLT